LLTGGAGGEPHAKVRDACWQDRPTASWFRHLLRGNDPDAERLYRWHIWCRDGGYEHDGTSRAEFEAVRNSRLLLHSMRARGYDADEPVRVGVNDRLLDGGHRVACALALRLPEIWQVKDPREARRTWGIDWFAAHGLDDGEQADLLLRFARMRGGSPNGCRAESV
jgi:hypothetical protein